MTVKRSAPRLSLIEEQRMNGAQRALMEAIRSGPRGKSISPRGPFAVWLHAPEFGQLAQALGGHCRYKTAVSPRLSEFAILCTARLWRAQYEWFAHAPIAERSGVKPKTIQDLRAGRVPKSATVELVGILGYYAMISMMLNVFRMMPPADAKLAFAEPK